MLRYRKINANVWLGHHKMAAYLANFYPACFLKCFDGVFARNVTESSHAIKRLPKPLRLHAAAGVLRVLFGLRPRAMR